MSRVGKKPIPIPANTKISYMGRSLTIEVKKGKLSRELHPDAPDDKDVYDALLKHLGANSDVVVVIRAESITSEDEFFREEIEIRSNKTHDWPFDNLLERNKEAKDIGRILGHRSGLSFVSAEVLRNTFSPDKRRSLEEAWKAFFQQYPGAKGYLSLSLPGLSQNYKRAIVYVTYHCGPLCGQGDVFYLKKEASQWKGESIGNIWIS